TDHHEAAVTGDDEGALAAAECDAESASGFVTQRSPGGLGDKAVARHSKEVAEHIERCAFAEDENGLVEQAFVLEKAGEAFVKNVVGDWVGGLNDDRRLRRYDGERVGARVRRITLELAEQPHQEILE